MNSKQELGIAGEIEAAKQIIESIEQGYYLFSDIATKHNSEKLSYSRIDNIIYNRMMLPVCYFEIKNKTKAWKHISVGGSEYHGIDTNKYLFYMAKDLEIPLYLVFLEQDVIKYVGRIRKLRPSIEVGKITYFDLKKEKIWLPLTDQIFNIIVKHCDKLTKQPNGNGENNI